MRETQLVERPLLPQPWTARSHQQEQFSDAFLLAIAAAAGCSTSRPVPDNDSVDWTLSCRLSRRPRLDLQLKSTIFPNSASTDIRYRLKIKNYNDLILQDLIVPRILVLVTLPRKVENWLDLTPDDMVLRHSAYWVSLAGEPPIRNNNSRTVVIPKRNLLTQVTLRDIMRRINDGAPL